jgi:hypothetical protein
VVESKDVVIAILGASAALAGFVLVFLGIVITSFQSYAGGVAEEVVRPYRVTGAALFASFLICVVTAAACFIWLAQGGRSSLYGWIVASFAIELLAVVAAAWWTIRMVLWR